MRAAAHDLNNLLTVINGLCELAKRDIGLGYLEKAIERLSCAVEVSNKCGEIVHRTFFAQSSQMKTGEFELNNLVRTIARQVESQMAERSIEVRGDLTAEPICIKGDELMIQRAIFNLCLNARDAIGTRGSILVKTREIEHGWAMLEVSDTGCGMSAEMLGTMWSRESAGEHGHGLGIVKRAIEEITGLIDVVSEEGRGTIFRIMLRTSSCAGMKAA